MLGVGVCAANMDGLWSPNSLSRVPFSADFPKLAKIVKMGSSPPKFIIKVGMTTTVRN